MPAAAKVAEGDVLPYVNATGGSLTLGTIIAIGDIFGLLSDCGMGTSGPNTTLANGSTGRVTVRGVVEALKVGSGGDVKSGQAAFWDATNTRFTPVEADGIYAGVFAENAASAGTRCKVLLNAPRPTGGNDYDATAITTVAAAGNAQGNAAALTGIVNNVTGADGTKGVVLPAAVAGLRRVVYNADTTNALKVYPASGDDINDGTADAEVSVPAKRIAIFEVALDGSTWTYVDYVDLRSAQTVAGLKTLTGGLTITTAGLTITDVNIVLNTATGTKIGTAVGQKLGFWNATPIAQPAGANQAALTNSTGGTGDGTLSAVGDTMAGNQAAVINNNFTELFTLLNEIRTVLVNTGIMKGAA